MLDCRTLEDANEATYNQLDILSPCNMTAFWTVVLKFLQKWGRGPSKKHDRQLHHQFDTILVHTLKEIKALKYRDLAQTTLGFAKIVKKRWW